NTISGFTKTKHDQEIVRGFQFTKDASGAVILKWKRDPALDPEWRGVDGLASGAGFDMFRSRPHGCPDLVAPNVNILKKKYLKTLKSQDMVDFMQAEGKGDAVQWIYDAAETGVVPATPLTTTDVPNGEWGALHWVGVVRPAYLRMIRPWSTWVSGSAGSMWNLPEDEAGGHVRARSNPHHVSFDSAIMASARLPAIRYEGQRAGGCAVAQHPNNAPAPGETAGAPAAAAGSSSGASGRQPAGQWNQEGDRHYYELDFSQCKPGMFFVAVCSYDGLGQGIAVGQVKSVDSTDKSFKAAEYCTAKEVVSADCVTAKWFKPAQRKKRRTSNRQSAGGGDADPGVLSTFASWAVVAYFQKLNKGGKLPKAAVDAVTERGIDWGSGCDESDSQNEGDEESGEE
ncbi:MAG: hypothetical protein GY813_04250, partial [Halieaceae bacterium]|nr:hypothetical protein [Halieaceae bacterium]